MRNGENFVSTPDFELFARQASRGLLYEYVRDEYNLPDRKNGKSMMFELAFSSHKNNSTDKCKLKKLFPAVVKYCDDYKIEHGDNQLAIWLQKEEAKLFIDRIYYDLKKQGLWVLTRHDSLVVKNMDKDHIKTFVENYFTSIKLNCNIEFK